MRRRPKAVTDRNGAPSRVPPRILLLRAAPGARRLPKLLLLANQLAYAWRRAHGYLFRLGWLAAVRGTYARRGPPWLSGKEREDWSECSGKGGKERYGVEESAIEGVRKKRKSDAEKVPGGKKRACEAVRHEEQEEGKSGPRSEVAAMRQPKERRRGGRGRVLSDRRIVKLADVKDRQMADWRESTRNTTDATLYTAVVSCCLFFMSYSHFLHPPSSYDI
ncbi:hypothetical protein KM043_004756 [Ampulex compressa]|nr:hypothetical protein KM043_004756 [Ampulex compressa]